MFDGFFELISGLLNFFYTWVPNYAVAIALLTCAVMVVTTPLTLKSTRSMIQMQRLQPEMKRLQAEYRGDRQKLNEEMMKFYKENDINPLGGCLPMLVQLPVFSILFWVVRGLINKSKFTGLAEAVPGSNVIGGFDPKYLSKDSELYTALHGESEMVSFGVDLANSPSQALTEGFLTALPYVLILVAIGGLAWYQQKQIMGRNQGSEITQQQRMMMRMGPVLQVGFTFISPMALGIYFLVSTAWRVGQQTYITHRHYKGEDSIGRQAQRAAAQARAEKDGKKKAPRDGDKAGAKPSRNGSGGATRKRQPSKTAARTSQGGRTRAQASKAGSRGTKAGAKTPQDSVPKARPHPRSRKKKKRK